MGRKKRGIKKVQLHKNFEPFKHDYPHAEIKEDGTEVHKFRFAVPRGRLDKRMSGLELAQFVVKEMSAVLGMGLLSHRPDINGEFLVLFNRLVTWPKDNLDEILPWIQVEWHVDDNDYIHLNLDAKKMFVKGTAPVIFS